MPKNQIYKGEMNHEQRKKNMNDREKRSVVIEWQKKNMRYVIIPKIKS